MIDSSVGCPLQTLLCHSWAEHSGPASQLPDIRAYKLGKKRWSYNQVELVLEEDDGGARTATVRQVVYAEGTKFQQVHQDSAVGFHVELESGAKLQAHIFLCYDRRGSSSGAATSSNGDGAAAVARSEHHAWQLVTRKDCCKGCEGRVLRSIQRFGRQGGKRCRNGNAKPTSAPAVDAAASSAAPAPVPSKKDPKVMYLSLDEACSHVDASSFRLVAGIYNRQGNRLLATSVSPPIRVLANNDVPTGAARIKLAVHLPVDWEGWAPQAPGPVSPGPSTTSRPRKQSAQAARPKLVASASTNSTSSTAALSNSPLPAIRTIPLSLNSSSEHGLAQPFCCFRVAQQQPQFSELSGFDVWQLPASSLASKLPQPARNIREDSGHLVCSAEASVHLVCSSGSPQLVTKAGNCVPVGDAAMQAEAARQLDLLDQLKAGLLAANQKSSSGNDAVLAASAAPVVAWTAVEPAAPRLAEPLSDDGSALAACWEQEVAQLQASSSMQATACSVMPQWQPTSHYSMPAGESPLMDSFGNFALSMPDSSSCDFGAADQDLETELCMMLASQHELSQIDMSDLDMVCLFPGDLTSP